MREDLPALQQRVIGRVDNVTNAIRELEASMFELQEKIDDMSLDDVRRGIVTQAREVLKLCFKKL